VGLLVLILELLPDGPAKNRASNADRRRRGTTGKESEGNERDEWLHKMSRLYHTGKKRLLELHPRREEE
jgi:hypothetical protein